MPFVKRSQVRPILAGMVLFWLPILALVAFNVWR